MRLQAYAGFDKDDPPPPTLDAKDFELADAAKERERLEREISRLKASVTALEGALRTAELVLRPYAK